MNNAIAIDLIREGVKGLLIDIQTDNDPWITREDLAEEKQLTDEDIVEWLLEKRGHHLDLVTMDSTYEEEFASLVLTMLESEWYEEKYQQAVIQSRQSIMEKLDWERTKKSLMPKL